MSEWTHSICERCWPAWSVLHHQGELHEPHRVQADDDVCCYCGGTHRSGIYVRDNQDSLPLCKGHE